VVGYGGAADTAVRGCFDSIVNGILEATSEVVMNQALADIRQELSSLEIKEPISILEFINSPHLLDMGEYIYPAGKWILSMFYEPWLYYEDFKTVWRGTEYVYPGFGAWGYTEEEVQNLYFNELTTCLGQRSLKSVISGVAVLYETFRLLNLPDPAVAYNLAPGTPFMISVAATAQQQSQDSVYAYIEAWRDRSPWFQKYIDKCKAMKLPNGHKVYHATGKDFEFEHKMLKVNAVHSKQGSLRGATRYAVVMDEIAWFDEGDKVNAKAVYDALMNSTKTFKYNAKKICISSPMHIADMINFLLAQCGTLFESPWYEGQGFETLDELNGRPISKNPRMLGFHYPTWECNPELPGSFFQIDLEINPESTLRDFGALPSAAIEAFFRDKEPLDAMFDALKPSPVLDNGELASWFKPKYNVEYHLHVDVGAGHPCNFGICLGHAEMLPDPETKENSPHLVIDLACAVKALPSGEMDFKKARELLDAIVRRFPVHTYSSDRWNDLEYMAKVRKKVQKVEGVVVDLEHYETLKTYIYMGRAKCHYAPLLKDELRRLELKNGKKIDHGINFTKDVADCVAAVAHRCVAKEIKKLPTGRAVAGVLGRG
jgi:hypothetical protein